jgi:hypothetical protein
VIRRFEPGAVAVGVHRVMTTTDGAAHVEIDPINFYYVTRKS